MKETACLKWQLEKTVLASKVQLTNDNSHFILSVSASPICISQNEQYITIIFLF